MIVIADEVIKNLRKLLRDNSKSQLELGLTFDNTDIKKKKPAEKRKKKKRKSPYNNQQIRLFTSLPSSFYISSSRLSCMATCERLFKHRYVDHASIPTNFPHAFGIVSHYMLDRFYKVNFASRDSFVNSFSFFWYLVRNADDHSLDKQRNMMVKRIGKVKVIGWDNVKKEKSVHVCDHSKEYEDKFTIHAAIGKKMMANVYDKFIKRRTTLEKNRIEIFNNEWLNFMELLEKEKHEYENKKTGPEFCWETIDSLAKKEYSWIKNNDWEKIVKKGGFAKMTGVLKRKALGYLEKKYPEQLSPLTEHNFRLNFKINYNGQDMNIPIVGVIDRIDFFKNNIWITDYKTDKKTTQITKDLNSLKSPGHQFPIYYLNAKKEFKRKPKASFKYYLRTGQYYEVPFIEEHAKWLEKGICKYLDAIFKNDFEQNIGYHCNYCDGYEICLREIRDFVSSEKRKVSFDSSESLEHEIKNHWEEIVEPEPEIFRDNI